MNVQKGKKGKFTYDGKPLSIMEILRKPGVSEYLQSNGPLAGGSLRNKLRRKLKAGNFNKEMVDEFLQQQRQRPFVLPQQRGSIEIDGERLTAKQALERYPQLHGYLQPQKRLQERTLHAKLIREYKNGRIPEHILNEDPPQFFQVSNHFNGTTEHEGRDERARMDG